MSSDDETWNELPESPKDETWEELLTVTKNFYVNPEQGVNKMESLLYGSFLLYIERIAAIHIKDIKGYLPEKEKLVILKLPKDKEPKSHLCSTFDDDYVEGFTEGFIAIKIIKYKALRDCNDITHLKKRLWNAIGEYIKNRLKKDEAKILTTEELRKVDRSNSFDAKYRDEYGTELGTLDRYTEKCAKIIIPRKIEFTSLYEGDPTEDVKICHDKEIVEQSDENVEMMKMAMEQAYSQMYPISGKVIKLFFETKRLEKRTRYEFKYTYKSKHNYKQIAELVNKEFPNANLSEGDVKERLTEKGKDLYNFVKILSGILEETKKPDEIKEIVKQIRRHKKKDEKENKKGGENL